jgi:hypothetical protein
MTTHDYYDPSLPIDRVRLHREAPRRSAAPAAIGTLMLVVVAVLGIDSLRGGGGPSSGGTNLIATVTTPESADAQADAATPSVTDPSAAGAGAAAAAEPAVDLEGCTLDVLKVAEGDQGPAVECVQKALTVAGFYSGPIDGVFTAQLATSASAFQGALGLYVDGIVGRQTSEALGIWPGDESFIVRTPEPPAGTYDSMGFELSSVASTGDAAPPMPPDTGQGTGKRIVYSRLNQRVWAVDDSEHVVRSYLVSGSQYNNEVPGKHKVYSKSEMTTAWNGQADLPLMVRWLDTVRGAIGFHQIPKHRSDGTLYQTDAELGQRLSGGCQRQTALDARFMWAFADIGTPVYVI